MRTIVAALLVGVVGFSQVGFSAEAVSDSQEALKYKLLESLLTHSAKPLQKHKGCNFKTSDASKHLTIAKWVAWNLSFFDQDKSNSISAACEPRKSAASVCRVEFRADSNGESPWSCGFRFQFNPKTEKLDPTTLECIGSC